MTRAIRGRILAGTALGLLMAATPPSIAAGMDRLSSSDLVNATRGAPNARIILAQAEALGEDERRREENGEQPPEDRGGEGAANGGQGGGASAGGQGQGQGQDAPPPEQPPAEEPPAEPAAEPQPPVGDDAPPAGAAAEPPPQDDGMLEGPVEEGPEPAPSPPPAQQDAPAEAVEPAPQDDGMLEGPVEEGPEPAPSPPPAQQDAPAEAAEPAPQDDGMLEGPVEEGPEPAPSQPPAQNAEPADAVDEQPEAGADDGAAADDELLEGPVEEGPEPAPSAPPAQQDGAPAEETEEQPEVGTDDELLEGPVEEGPEPAPDAPPAEDGEPADEAEEQPEEATDGAPADAAPVLDSQKDADAEGAPTAAPDGSAGSSAEQPADDGQQAGEAAPPPASDEEAQQPLAIGDLESVIGEEGRRIEGRRPPRRERREDAEVVREFGDRIVIRFGDQIVVEGGDRDRLVRDAREVYYEELPRGRTREVIVRADGTRVVTIRNRYGDVLRRARITPDGDEYVLVYVPRERWGEGERRWRDPARDLPPLRLTIPVSEYILEAERVEDPQAYYEFLDQPPVERVERLYTVDDVRYSSRVRDKVRRVDLDTVNFEFGSAEIPESEIDELEALALAIDRMIEQNPGETFLIEGHTDAVGSDLANLALSDRRADAVARALTNVFGIPPENLVTQGYGERYLKIETPERERENRRVAVRRITPLVAPVASAR
ncbi:OmpA family protein [Aquibium sp. A9E412]|uniref:OmpA family protein n=1 Tax=Aquibium sp. A9E412 TaxID=2976767 RepID=UPI0025B09D06|nr:OmpA family protein [Aquibium sp. A9E412]MDN2566544.1 OmpA family protein [Aquibium sp. A9E412]